MGLGEGVAFPAIHSIISRSIPQDKQSTAVGVVTAASYAGTAVAFGLAPTIIEELGWPVRGWSTLCRCRVRPPPATGCRRCAVLRFDGGVGCRAVVLPCMPCMPSCLTHLPVASTVPFPLADRSRPAASAPPAALQWVFYLFGASAALWLPFWLPQRMEGGSSSRHGGGGGGKSFSLMSLFATADADDASLRLTPDREAQGQAGSSGGARPSLDAVAGEGSKQRLQTARSLPDDAGGGLEAAAARESNGQGACTSSSSAVHRLACAATSWP